MLPIDFDAVQPAESGGLPENVGADAPGFSAKPGAFARRQTIARGAKQNLSVKIRHSTSPRWSES